jgi:predicted nucleotidyltransferase
MAHTPGPWSRNISPARKYPTIFAGRNSHVCTLVSQRRDDAELEANANLIAASPDLLAALKEAASMLDYVAAVGLEALDASKRVPGIQARVEAAIAKAEGHD